MISQKERKLQKILYLLTKSDVGGAQKYVRDLAANLDPNSFESKILYGGKDVRWLGNAIRPWFFFANDWLAIIELVRVFRREQPAIIHLNSSKAGVVVTIAAALYKLSLRFLPRTYYVLLPRVVFTAHGWVFQPGNDLSRGARFAYRLLHRFAALFQDTIITVSEYDRTLALRYKIAPASKLVTIHNGIDPNAISFLSKEEARKEIQKRLKTYDLGLMTSNPWVGSLGRLTKEKNYKTFIEAAREVPNAYFFVIGDGPEQKDLRLKTYDLGLIERVFFVPPHGDDAILLKAFDVFTLSSIKEGLPYSLLEALSAGVKVVVTDAGGMSEAIRHCPGTSIVPIHNAQALAAEIQNTLNQKTKTIPCIPFPLDAMVTKTAMLYISVCHSRESGNLG